MYYPRKEHALLICVDWAIARATRKYDKYSIVYGRKCIRNIQFAYTPYVPAHTPVHMAQQHNMNISFESVELQ